MAPAGVLFAARHHQCQRQRSLLNWIQQSEDSPIPSRTCACPPASPPCSWLSTLTPGFLEQLTTGWPGPSLVKLPLKLVLTSSWPQILMCFRFPGCWSGSQHLGVVSARPSLGAHGGPHWLRRWRGASTSKPVWLIWEIDFDVQRSYLHIAWFWLSIYFCVPFKYLLTHSDVFSVEFRWD